MSIVETGEIIPLKVRVSDGSVAPEPLTQKRTATSREEILSGLSLKEAMLVAAIVTSLEQLAGIGKWGPEPSGDVRRIIAMPLLQAFQDATGVDYVGCAWDA